MNEIGKVGRASGIAARHVTSRKGFSVPESARDTAAVERSDAVAGASLLALQAVEDDPAQRNRMARAGGEAALDALRDLQAALLKNQDDPDARARLSALLSLNPAADPELASIVQEISVRAAIELALRQ